LRVRQLVATGCLMVASSLAVAACGSDSGNGSVSSRSGSTGSSTVTIYSSMPLQGESRSQSVSIINAEKLALEKAGGTVGAFTVKFKSLDDATAAAGMWDPTATSANARKAAQDKSTIAYLGEFNSGASAISIPILNEVGILQVSPASTAVGLTRAQGAGKGEPDKYYPSGTRTFGRVVPADQIQAAAQVMYQKGNGCTKLSVLDDKELDGESLAQQVVTAAKAQGLAVVGEDGIDPKAANYRSLAATIESEGADCVFFGGIIESNAVQLFKDLHEANPTAKLFGPGVLAVPPFIGRLGPAVEKVTYLTNPRLDPKLYPPAGQRFFEDYRATFGTVPEPYAIFGYEAMGVVLNAIKNAGDQGNDRQAVIDEFFKTKNRRSVLGTYSIDENGDTTLSSYGAYRVKKGKLVFERVIRVRP